MTSGYVMVGYGLIWVSLLGYSWRIRRRLVVAERDLAAMSSTSKKKE